MLRFIEKTASDEVKAKLPHIEEALEVLAEVISEYRLDTVQDWDEVREFFDEKTDNFMKSVAQSMKTGKIDHKPSKGDKAKASSAYKNSSADVQQKLDMLKKAGQSKPKPVAKPPAPKPAVKKPVPPKPAAPKPPAPKPATPAKPKQEDSEHGVPALPGNTDGGSAWTPGKVIGSTMKEKTFKGPYYALQGKFEYVFCPNCGEWHNVTNLVHGVDYQYVCSKCKRLVKIHVPTRAEFYALMRK
jgi:hypothetical protein